MLHRRTVEPSTFSLLNELMALPQLSEFYLVGGTALALQIGHRWSVDLDLFCDLVWDSESIMDSLPRPLEKAAASPVFQGYFIRDVKCDFVRYSYPRQLSLVEEDGIRMASTLEIAAMKLMAITNRGKKKDFFDLHFLFKMYSMTEIFDLFVKKYPETQPFLVLRSLCYFGDAEKEDDPIMFERIDWETIKKSIRTSVIGFAN
jgi:predicted nucleotidyltransferase component of viral defense system